MGAIRGDHLALRDPTNGIPNSREINQCRKIEKDDEPNLTRLKGRVRVQEVLQRLEASLYEADLTTEALDDMASQAVLEIADRIDARLKSQDDKYKWLIGLKVEETRKLPSAQVAPRATSIQPIC